MKRIRNIKDLEFEKLRLRVKQLELEKQMERSWKEVTKKLSLADHQEKNIPVQSSSHSKPTHPIISGALSYGASFLSHKFGMIAGKKAEGLAEQLLEKITGKITAAFSRNKKR